MGNPFFGGGGLPGRGGGNPFFGGSAPDPEGAAEVAQLEQLQQQTGAPSIIQDKPGAFARAVDVLQRFNFGSAGLADELLVRNNTFAGALKRAGTEIFSGLFGLKGEKRTFSNVLESLDVGAGPTLSQALPFLFTETGEGLAFQRSGPLDVTGRGTAGLALDIFLDPTTYITGGASKAATIGGRALSKSGLLARVAEFKGLVKHSADGALDLAKSAPEVVEVARKAQGLEDLIGRKLSSTEIQQLGRESAEGVTLRGPVGEGSVLEGVSRPRSILAPLGTRLEDIAVAPGSSAVAAARELGESQANLRVLSAIENGATHLLDKGGIKWFGHSIPGTPRLALVGSDVSRWVVDRVSSVSPDAAAALESVKAAKDNIVDAFGRVLNVAWDARKLGFRSYLDSRRSFLNTMDLNIERANGRISGSAVGELEKRGTDFERLSRLYEEGGVEFVANGGVVAGKTLKGFGSGSLESRAMTHYRDQMTEIRRAELQAGIETPEKANYFAHYYDNTPDELRRIYKAVQGRDTPKYGALDRHLEERVYSTYAQAVTDSTARSLTDSTVPVLRPVWSPAETLRRRTTKSIESISWRGWTENIAEKMGADAVFSNPKLIYELGEGTGEVLSNPRDAERIYRVINGPEKIVPSSIPVSGSKLTGSARGVSEETIHDQLRENVTKLDDAVRAGDKEAASTANQNIGILEGAGARLDGPSGEVFTPFQMPVPPGRQLEIRVGDDMFTEAELGDEVLVTLQANPRASAEVLSRVAKGKPYVIRIRDGATGGRTTRTIRGATPDDGVELARKLSAERLNIEAKNALPDESVDFVRGLQGDAAKREFMRQRLMRVSNRDELIKVLNDYDEFSEFFPRRRNVDAFDGVGVAANTDELLGIQFSPIKLAGLGDVDLPTAIARDIEAMNRKLFNNREFGTLVRGWDKVTNAWKTAVTVFWPSFHIRNAYSNVAQSFVDVGIGALDPKMHAESVRILSGAGGNVVLGGRVYARSEIRELFREQGVIIPGESLLEYTGVRTASKTALGKLVDAPGNFGRKIGGKIENEARVQLAINWLRRGASLDEAAERVNKFLFDYKHGLTDVEREFFRRIFPFWTWQSKNFRLMFDNLKKRPGLLSAELKPFVGRPDQNEQMTSYESGDLKLILNQDGKSVYMVNGIDLPINNIELIWGGNMGRTARGMIGMSHPAIKTIGELATGKSLFTGRDIDRRNSPAIGRIVGKFPESMRNFIGYAETVDDAGKRRISFDGRRYALIENALLANRIVSTSDRVFRNYVDEDESNWQLALLDVAVGLRVRETTWTELQARRTNERIRLLQESLVRRGAGAEFQKFFVPKSVKDGATKF